VKIAAIPNPTGKTRPSDSLTHCGLFSIDNWQLAIHNQFPEVLEGGVGRQ